MPQWLSRLRRDPVPVLLTADDLALIYFVRRDLCGEEIGAITSSWELLEPRRLLRKQRTDGSWRYAGGNPETSSGSNYAVLETYRSLGVLVEMYGLDRSHPKLAAAAEYIFSCQTAEGDIRGVLGNQYMPYYHAAILELLIKAGYADDARVTRGLEWLLSVRQTDGGWIVPMQPCRPGNAAATSGQGRPCRPTGRGLSHIWPPEWSCAPLRRIRPTAATPLRWQQRPC